MRIPVMYRDGTYGVEKDISIDQLVRSERILMFCRSGSWAVIGRDPVRGMGGSGAGYRRRKFDKLTCVP